MVCTDVGCQILQEMFIPVRRQKRNKVTILPDNRNVVSSILRVIATVEQDTLGSVTVDWLHSNSVKKSLTSQRNVRTVPTNSDGKIEFYFEVFLSEMMTDRYSSTLMRWRAALV